MYLVKKRCMMGSTTLTLFPVGQSLCCVREGVVVVLLIFLLCRALRKNRRQLPLFTPAMSRLIGP